MCGKWTSLKTKLPKFEAEPEYAAKVEEIKGQFIGLATAELAREFKRARAQKKEFEEQVYDLNVGLEALSQLLIADLEARAIQKMQLTTGETVYIQDEPYASVADQAALLAWVKKQKLTGLLSLNWQTMNGIVKEHLAAGRPAPPGVKVFMKTSARLRNGASGSEE